MGGHHFLCVMQYTLYLYTRYPIVALGLPLGRVRRASKGILHTNIIPLLARVLGLKARPSARATIGNLVYKKIRTIESFGGKIYISKG